MGSDFNYEKFKLDFTWLQLCRNFEILVPRMFFCLWRFNMSAFKRVQQWSTFSIVWHIYDAKWQNPFDSAALIAKYLRGLHKPIYHPINTCGDQVVVINCKHVAMPGDEWKRRVYFHHTGYAGGATWTMAWELHKKDPSMIMRKAIQSALPGNITRQLLLKRVHLYDEEDVPEDILANVTSQLPQLRPIPKKLSSFTEKEIQEFPKIEDYKKDFILS